MPAMATSPSRWDHASRAPLAAGGQRVAEIAQLGPGLPDAATLFTFTRDAELRFSTLRLRLEERVAIATGETLRVHEVLLRHPGRARVTVRRPDRPAPVDHEIWLSDGTTIRTYQAGHRLATLRPARARVSGIDGRDLPGTGRAYLPLTALPANSLADVFVHPAGFAQNVLATAACTITGEALVGGRPAILLVADHPRTILMAGDHPDHRFEIAVDRETGVLSRLVEAFGDRVTRHVEAVELSPGSPIPDSAFSVAIPDDAALIY